MRSSKGRTIVHHSADTRSRAGLVIGLAGVAGAFGAAALLSAATAPSAHADPYTDIINAVDGGYALGHRFHNRRVGLQQE